MGRPQVELAVRCAGRDWLFRLDREELRDEIASKLGSRAREVGPGTRPEDAARQVGTSQGPDDAAGTIAMSETGLPPEEPREEWTADGCRLVTRGFRVSVTGAEGAQRAEVAYRRGRGLAAAGVALRTVVMRGVMTGGGLVLHASSVRTPRGVVVFVGRSGSGKTTAARAFPPPDRLDDDLVLLAREEGRWVRLSAPDTAGGPPPRDEEGLPVLAVLLPERGEAFELEPLAGAEAVRGCLHLPWLAGRPSGERGGEELSGLLARTEDLARSVRVARVAWALSDDLPALVERAL